MWEETRVSRVSPHRHGEDMQTPPRWSPGSGSKQESLTLILCKRKLMFYNVYLHWNIIFPCLLCMLDRVEEVLAQFLCGHLAMVAERKTTVTVMAIPTASTPCPLAAPLSMVMCHGTVKPAPPPSLPPTAAATSTKNRS